MDKKEIIRKYLSEFKNYCDTAQQHEFPRLMAYNIVFNRTCSELEKEWNEDRADWLIEGFQTFFRCTPSVNQKVREQV